MMSDVSDYANELKEIHTGLNRRIARAENPRAALDHCRALERSASELLDESQRIKRAILSDQESLDSLKSRRDAIAHGLEVLYFAVRRRMPKAAIIKVVRRVVAVGSK